MQMKERNMFKKGRKETSKLQRKRQLLPLLRPPEYNWASPCHSVRHFKHLLLPHPSSADDEDKR